MSETFLILGAGQAACQAAATLRSEGFAGTVLVVGDEPYAPYQRPPLSKKFLMGEIGVDRLELKPQSFYESHNITLKLGVNATTIDRATRRVKLSDGTIQSYNKLLIATGARVRRVPIPGAELESVYYLRNINDVDRIRPNLAPGRRLGLVGGGYIGLEVAAVAAKLGCDVTVIEMAERVMSRVVSEPVSAFYEAEHRRAGVKLELDAMVAGFESEGGKLSCVRLTDGRRIGADFAVVGVGVEPNVGLAESAGITCKNGILVDEFGQTSDPNIFAAGDCTNHPNPFVGGLIRLESVQNAIDQAKHAALAMLGRPTPYGEVPWFWSDQYDLKLQIAGIRDGFDEMVMRGSTEKRSFAVFYLRGGLSEGHVIAVEAINAVPEYMIGRKLIAARQPIAAGRLADPAVPMKALLTS